MLRTINVTFTDEEYQVLTWLKKRRHVTWHDLLTSIVTLEDLQKYRETIEKKIDPKRIKDQVYVSKPGVGWKEYCARCGTEISPENFSYNWCPKCGSGLKTHGLYAVAEDGSEGYVSRNSRPVLKVDEEKETK